MHHNRSLVDDSFMTDKTYNLAKNIAKGFYY